jgi:hypothetical protein
MSGWHWQSWSDLPYLTCDLLKNWQHGFFTRQFSPRSPFELTQVLHPTAQGYRLKQVHGKEVLTPTETTNPTIIDPETGFAMADGLITDTANQGVWVASADCNPILIGCAKTGQVSAIHAGWRGTALKIVPHAIQRLIDHGSSLESLVVGIGPAIAGSVYQVSSHVGAEVCHTLFPDQEIDRVLDLAKDLPNPPILDDDHPDRVKLDVRRVNALQLLHMGLSTDQVSVSPHCTFQEGDRFFSYRRDKLKNVQWSGIVSNN